jgi:retron-type reverse transcriptase
LRCLAIETVYKTEGNKTSGVEESSLLQATLQEHLDFIDFKNLHSYKASNLKQVVVSGADAERPTGILTIKDKIVQTLFVQLVEPTLDV